MPKKGLRTIGSVCVTAVLTFTGVSALQAVVNPPLQELERMWPPDDGAPPPPAVMAPAEPGSDGASRADATGQGPDQVTPAPCGLLCLEPARGFVDTASEDPAAGDGEGQPRARQAQQAPGRDGDDGVRPDAADRPVDEPSTAPGDASSGPSPAPSASPYSRRPAEAGSLDGSQSGQLAPQSVPGPSPAAGREGDAPRGG
jgi:hypothetical protein